MMRNESGIMYEYAMKTFVHRSVFGKGLLELVETIGSFAQAFDLEPICRCEGCMASRGENETERLEKEREDKILAFTLDSFAEYIDKLYEDDESPYNNSWHHTKGVYFEYATSGGLCMEVEINDSQDCIFRVYPPTDDGRFREGSTLLNDLLDIGYGHVQVTVTYKDQYLTNQRALKKRREDLLSMMDDEEWAKNAFLCEMKDQGNIDVLSNFYLTLEDVRYGRLARAYSSACDEFLKGENHDEN